MEEFPQSENKSLEDLSNQVIALVTRKIEESIPIKNQSTSYTPLNSTGLPTIEFPKFSGDGFSDWKYKCEKLFELYKTADDIKVKLASIHLEGDALRWHRAHEKKTISESYSWGDYTEKMESQFGGENGLEKNKTQSDYTGRKIHGTEDEVKISKLHYRFGPIYRRHEHPEHTRIKDDAWKHLLKHTPDRAAVTTEKYLFAMRKIENVARATYADGEMGNLSGPEFRWMMIKDGCFFLQLALYALEGRLGYLEGHDIFDNKKSEKHKDIKEVIEAVFFVGNQIPFIVLNELMKQKYFQEVIKETDWKQPSDLYELLVLPAVLQVQDSFAQRCWRSSKAVKYSRARWLQQQKPCDVLHGLQLLVLGPKNQRENREGEEVDEQEDDEEDLEAQNNLRNTKENDENRPSFSATDLRNSSGIHFRIVSRMGSRGIHFSNRKLFLKAFPILYLPPLLVGDDTELMFRCLRNYEICQRLSRSKQEVSSYLFFMSELLHKSEDAKLIGNKGILKGESKQKSKVPGMLKSIAPEESYNQNLRRVMLEIRDYSPPLWMRYWHIISFAFLLTILQTVYTILPYYKG